MVQIRVCVKVVTRNVMLNLSNRPLYLYLVYVHMYARKARKKTKCLVPLGPLCEKQNIQAKEVYTSQSSAIGKVA